MGRSVGMASAGPEAPKRQTSMHRTVTGSQMELSEMESLIHSASMRGQDTETSSVASSSQTGRSNIIQIQPGKKNIKAAIKAALAEAQGYDDPDEPPVRPLEDMQLDDDDDDDAAYDMSSPSTPSKRSRPSVELKQDVLRAHASEPLHGAGTAYRAYSESSAPPEGAGGYSAGEFVPPVVTEQKPPSRRRQEPLGNGLHRTVTGSSLKLSELNDYIEKAGEQECPKTPSSHGGRTPRSLSGMSLNSGSRSSSIVQIQPGVKDIRTALANAIADGGDSYTDRSPTDGGMNDRQSLGGGSHGGSFSGSMGGTNTPGGTNAFGSVTGGGSQGQIHRPRSIRRLMSEKSFNMDTVYSGMLMDNDLPSEPLEGTGVVSGRKYVEPKHGPQFNSEAPKDFPRVVNGVPTTGSGDYEAVDQRSSIPPSPSAAGLAGGMRKSGVHRTVSGSQMDLAELGAIMEKAVVPKSQRSSQDCSRSSTAGGSGTFRTVKGSGLGSSHGSQVFGEELEDEPIGTFGHRACSISEQEIQELINKASVPRSVSAVSERSEPDSPRSVRSGSSTDPLASISEVA